MFLRQKQLLVLLFFIFSDHRKVLRTTFSIIRFYFFRSQGGSQDNF